MATPPNQMGLTGPVQANDIVMRASEIGTTIPGIASLAMKSARKGAQRGVQGIYQLPSGNEPTPEFMNVAQQNLNNQTRQMTNMLNMMAPEDEQLAYINEEEAGILKLLGGSGEMTPQGIPTYRGIGGYGGGNEGPASGGSSGSSGTGGMGGQGQGGPTGTGGQSPGPGGPGGGMVAGATPGADGNATGGTSAGFGAGGGSGSVGGEPDRDYRESVEEAAETEMDRETMESIAKKAATITDKYGNPVTSTNPETGVKTNVFSQKAVDKAMKDFDDRKAREAYYNQMLSEDFYDDNPAFRFDQRPALSSIAVNELGDPDFSSIDPSAYGTYEGKMQDRLGELTAKAKKNTLEGDELNELAQLNEFFGKNPTTGMGIVESLQYQFTNPEFKEDLAKAAPVLGAAALTAFAPMGLKSIFSIGKALMSFTDTTPKSLKDTMQKALDKLTGGEKKALAKSLPSTYRGFGIQGENRGGAGEDRREAEAEAARRAREEAERRAREEEENNRERDRFERSFANRYFVGPASLDEVRKYAITGGGYNQLTPFYGREKETV